MSKLIGIDGKEIEGSEEITPSLSAPVQSMEIKELDEQTGNVKGTALIDYNHPVHTDYGVQLWEEGKLKGVCLYSTVVKAKAIAEEMNKEFARLNVKHEAKIINYPVF
jgi:hypothetical protein